jgi:DNA polymerase-1
MKKVIIAADYSSLEPRIFAHCSGSKTLQAVYSRGEDLYSRVAIDVLKVPNVSAMEDAPNYLKKVAPEMRQAAKVFTLEVPYNASAWMVAMSMGYFTDKGKVDIQRGQKLIDDYLNSYPELREYMARCKYNATRKGYVTNEFGRIRNLYKAKEIFDQYGMDVLYSRYPEHAPIKRMLKGLLNAACNHPVQSTAADVVNRAMIELGREYRKRNLPASIRLQVHDEIVVIADYEAREEAAHWLTHCMANNEYTKRLLVPLTAEAKIGYTLAEVK